MKINWGWKIVLVFACFVTLILTMVFKTMHMTVDLVRPDYYAEELRYQERIDERSNTSQLTQPPRVRFNGSQVEVSFPDEMKKTSMEGQIHFYRPSDSRLDFKVELQTDSNGFQRIDAPRQGGMYQVKLAWKANGKSYYSESTVMIP